MDKPIDFGRYMTMTDALLRMLSNAELPPNIAEAVEALSAERGAWPEVDVGRMVMTKFPLVINPGENRKLDLMIPSDKPFLLARIEAMMDVGDLSVLLYDFAGVKYVATSTGSVLDGCWTVVNVRQLILFELSNKDQHAAATVKSVRVMGFILDEP